MGGVRSGGLVQGVPFVTPKAPMWRGPHVSSRVPSGPLMKEGGCRELLPLVIGGEQVGVA